MRRCKNWLTSYLEFTELLESPTSYHIWCGLSTVAACLRRQVWVNMGYFRVYPNLFVVLVAPAGRCRKTVAIAVATSLLQDFSDVRLSADNITREALIKAVKTSEVMCVMPDKTIYMHSSLTIISKELSVFLGTGNHDLLSLLTDLFDCPDKWEYRTKGSGVDSCIGIWLNMLAASTPSWLVGSIPLTAIGGGFTSRVIFVVEDDVRLKNPLPLLTDRQLRIREDLVFDLEQIQMSRGEYQLTKKAQEWFSEWYLRDNTKINDPRFWGYSERKHIHLLKVATLISVCEGGPNIIDEVHLAMALKLINALEPSMVDAFGAAGRSELAPDIDLILNYIIEKKAVTKEQIYNSTWRDVDPRVLDIIIDTLKNMGKITIIPKEGKVWFEYCG